MVETDENGFILIDGKKYIGGIPNFWLYATLLFLAFVIATFIIVYMAYNAGMIHTQYW